MGGLALSRHPQPSVRTCRVGRASAPSPAFLAPGVEPIQCNHVPSLRRWEPSDGCGQAPTAVGGTWNPSALGAPGSGERPVRALVLVLQASRGSVSPPVAGGPRAGGEPPEGPSSVFPRPQSRQQQQWVCLRALSVTGAGLGPPSRVISRSHAVAVSRGLSPGSRLPGLLAGPLSGRVSAGTVEAEGLLGWGSQSWLPLGPTGHAEEHTQGPPGQTVAAAGPHGAGDAGREAQRAEAAGRPGGRDPAADQEHQRPQQPQQGGCGPRPCPRPDPSLAHNMGMGCLGPFSNLLLEP